MSLEQIDLAILDGDLSIKNGRIALEVGDNVIGNSIIRRLSTPINIYSRTILQGDDVVTLDEDYGNPAYNLTALDSNLVIERMRNALAESLQKDPRIIVNSISFQESIPNVNIVIDYTVKGSNTSQTLTITP